MLEIFNNNFSSIKNSLTAYSVSDEETKQTIKHVYQTDKYLLDPHGAVAYLSLKKYLVSHPGDKGYFLETAHPVKFYDVIEKITQEKIDLNSFDTFKNKEKLSIKMEVNYDALKEILLQKN